MQVKKVKILKFLLPYILRYRGCLFGAVVFLLVASGATLALPLFVGRLLDSGGIATSMGGSFVLLFVLGFILALASSARYYFVIWLGEKIVADIRVDIFSHVLGLSAGFFDERKSGDLVANLTSDTVLIKSVAGATASMALRNLLLLVGAIFALLYTSLFLSGVTFVLLPFIILPIMLLGRRVRSRSKLAQDELANVGSSALAIIEGVRVVQAFNQQRAVAGKFSVAVERMFLAMRRSFLLRAVLTFVAIFITFSSVLLLLWLGVNGVVEGYITAGNLVQFIIYAILAAASIAALSEVWGEVSQAGGAVERIANVLNEKNSVTTKTPIAEITGGGVKGEIIFKNVSFNYAKKQGGGVLRGLDLAVKAGSRVAIVGGSGSGKTTLFNLLLRHYNVDGGKILFDGVDIANIRPQDLRKHISIVAQENVIFAESIYENIRFARPGASSDEVYAAGKLALVDEFANRLQGGYGALVGERGVNLSVGQRQRLMLARVFLRNSAVILFDEATSSLDAKSEKLILDSMAKLAAGKTVIIIAHRFSTVMNCDKIFVIDGGKIVESGDHKSLMALGGLYASFAKLQLEKKE